MTDEGQKRIDVMIEDKNYQKHLEQLQSEIESNFDNISVRYEKRGEVQEQTTSDTRIEDPTTVEIIGGYLVVKYVEGMVSGMGANHGKKIQRYIRNYLEKRDIEIVSFAEVDFSNDSIKPYTGKSFSEHLNVGPTDENNEDNGEESA